MNFAKEKEDTQYVSLILSQRRKFHSEKLPAILGQEKAFSLQVMLV